MGQDYPEPLEWMTTGGATGQLPSPPCVIKVSLADELTDSAVAISSSFWVYGSPGLCWFQIPNVQKKGYEEVAHCGQVFYFPVILTSEPNFVIWQKKFVYVVRLPILLQYSGPSILRPPAIKDHICLVPWVVLK